VTNKQREILENILRQQIAAAQKDQEDSARLNSLQNSLDMLGAVKLQQIQSRYKKDHLNKENQNQVKLIRNLDKTREQELVGFLSQEYDDLTRLSPKVKGYVGT
jgi:hypothetical protein